MSWKFVDSSQIAPAAKYNPENGVSASVWRKSLEPIIDHALFVGCSPEVLVGGFARPLAPDNGNRPVRPL
jgi:hypothetical protein